MQIEYQATIKLSVFADSEAEAKQHFEDTLDDCMFNFREDSSGIRIEAIRDDHGYIGQQALDLN
jgi:hypothetical protein